MRTTQKGLHTKIECRFELSQNKLSIHGTSYVIMKNISEYFNASFKDVRDSTTNPQHQIRTLSALSNFKVINYLNKYPLMGSKHLDFLS